MQNPNLSANRPRVLIADDHSVVAEGVRSLLKNDCEVVGVVSDGRQLLETAPQLKPDLFILDITMPLLNGLDAARRVKSLLPNAKFVFLTIGDDPNLAAAAFDLGAVGYVLKQAAASGLIKADPGVVQA